VGLRDLSVHERLLSEVKKHWRAREEDSLSGLSCSLHIFCAQSYVGRCVAVGDISEERGEFGCVSS
jgi:hypothetical protein